MITKLNAKNGLQRLKFSKFDADFKQENNIDANEEKRDEEDEDILIYRKPKEWEVWDRHQNPDVSMIPRNVPILERDQNLEELTDRALAFSNIIRGFSFFPGNEKFLVNNLELLDLIGRLLLLKVGVDEQQLLVKHPKIKVKTEEEDEKVKLEKDMQKYVAPERDSNEKLLMEIANQLRDDAFTILAHVSVQLDLYNVDPEISYRIFDALLHWGVTTNIQAKDPFYPSVISPRSYVFEIICKMSLLETNIDLLLATGAWPRTEEFIRVVSNSITMAEELPNREFAIVILTAMCQASEPACIVSALETQVVQNLISFLEAAEFNINQIAGNEGVHSLRDNPERIGTSFGMLRRAAQILASFAQYEICRPLFVKHQSRLLSFTVSSYVSTLLYFCFFFVLFFVYLFWIILFWSSEAITSSSNSGSLCFERKKSKNIALALEFLFCSSGSRFFFHYFFGRPCFSRFLLHFFLRKVLFCGVFKRKLGVLPFKCILSWLKSAKGGRKRHRKDYLIALFKFLKRIPLSLGLNPPKTVHLWRK